MLKFQRNLTVNFTLSGEAVVRCLQELNRVRAAPRHGYCLTPYRRSWPTGKGRKLKEGRKAYKRREKKTDVTCKRYDHLPRKTDRIDGQTVRIRVQ